jgi:hypothetical protein
LQEEERLRATRYVEREAARAQKSASAAAQSAQSAK